MKNLNIFECPGGSGTSVGPSPQLSMQGGMYLQYNYNLTWDLPKLHYGLNGELAYAWPSVNYSRVSLPAETVLLADSGYVDYESGALDQLDSVQSCGGLPQEYIMYCFPSTVGRHGGLTNVTWLDGHSKTVHVQPQTWDYFGAMTAENFKKLSTGYVLKAGCNVDDAKCLAYLYTLSGPVSPEPGALSK
jgi:hypothetical protein